MGRARPQMSHYGGARERWRPQPLSSPPLVRIANSNSMNKSESDQEDNDDINDNDWSYGSEKKGVWGSGESWGGIG